MNVAEATIPRDLEQSWFCVNDPSFIGIVLPDNAPPSALLFSSLTPYGEFSVSSGHKVKKMQVHEGPETGQVVYFKLCDSTYPPILAQIESALSASYRIVRGEAAPRVRPVVNPAGEVIGVASYELPEFKSMDGQQLSAEEMVSMGVAEGLVSRYVRMEDDLHAGNMGVTPRLGLVDIDFDMSLYPLTSEIKGPRFINNGIFAPLPSNAYPITNADIDNFPDIQDAQPCFWPTKFPNKSDWRKGFSNREEFKKLKDEKAFIPRKYFAFLKELLIDPETHFQIMEPSFSRDAEAKEMQGKIKASLEKRWGLLEEVLVSNEGFRKFVVHNKKIFQGCLDHFKDYNETIAGDGVKFDLDRLEERYQAVVRKCMVKDLTLAVYDLGFKLKSKRDDWSKFKGYYHQLIDIFIEFQNERTSFLQAFFLLDCERTRLEGQMGEQKKSWEHRCSNVSKVVDNYRGLVTRKSEEEVPVQSIFLRHSQGGPVVPGSGVSLDKEASLAKALYKMLLDSQNNKKILAIARECLEEYKPIVIKTPFGSYEPMGYFRERVPNLEALVSSRTVEQISSFLSSGAWNAAGRLRGASANVLLISKLCESILKGFEKQIITLEQLRKHDLVEVCYEREGGRWNLENSAQKISENLQQLIRGKARLSQLEDPEEK